MRGANQLIRSKWSNGVRKTLNISEFRFPHEKICAVAKETIGRQCHVMAKVFQTSFFALMDSGAAVSVVSSSFVERLGLELINEKPIISYYSCGSNKLNMTGSVTIKVEIGKATITEKFLVAENLSQSMIIGADVLERRGIDIVYSEKKVRLEGFDVPMYGSHSQTVSEINVDHKPSRDAKIDRAHLRPDEVKQLEELLDKFPEVFSRDDEDIGSSEFIHKIELFDYTPVKSRAYRIPHSQKPTVEAEVIKMLRMGVIQRTNSDWSSPVVLVKKKDDSIRFCTDFRKLNAVTVKDNYPLPLIEEKLESFVGKKFFSSLDMTAGYWQFLVDPKARKLTTFVCHMGSYEYLRMPFGLCNAGATFQRAMEGVLEGLDCASPYVDDVLTSSSSFKEHLVDLEKVLTRLQDAKLKIKSRKCSFGFQETKFLGFIISKDGIKVCPSREECIRNYPVPKCAKHVRQFLGLASYYRKFIKSFATISEPLSQLTHKVIKFEWDPKCEKAFRTLIDRLLNTPVLIFPDFTRRFRLSTDASNCGLGAVLSQVDDEGNEQVVAYASRTLNAAEKNYTTTEQELLAIIWACERFRAYLFGVEFDLITDHKPLTYLSSLNLSSSRLIRWKMRLQEYSFKIEHKAGKEHINADVLSRMHEQVIASVEVGELIDNKYIISNQDTDVEIKRIKKLLKSNSNSVPGYQLVDGILFKERKKSKTYESINQLRLVIPRCMIGQVLTLCHDHICGGHLGAVKTLAKVTERYHWKGVKEDVMNWVASCPECAERKDPPSQRAPLGSITDPKIPFDKIGIDFLGPLTETKNGHKHILVITDYASRWVEAFPTADQTAATVAKILINEVICRHGAPRELLSDKGQNFMSKVVKELCSYFETKKINTTSYHPQCNGLTERFNKTLCQLLAMYGDEHQDNWDILLPLVLFAYRTSQQKTVNETPFRLLYGRDARLPADIDRWSTKAHFINDIDKAWKEARSLIQRQAEKATLASEKKYPLTKPFKVGDQVRLHCPVTKIGLKNKLRRVQWAGPFTVTKVITPNVEVETGRNNVVVHSNRVKTAEPKRSMYGRIYRPVDRYGSVSNQ